MNDNHVQRALDAVDKAYAEGDVGAAVRALRNGTLERAAKADNRERRAASKARVRSQMDADGFMAVGDFKPYFRGVSRHNTVRLKGRKGAWIVLGQDRSVSHIRVAPASFGPLRAAKFGDREIPYGQQKRVESKTVTHVLMSKRYGR